MSNITLTKKAAEAIRDALSALISNEKQAQAATAKQEKQAADRQQAATKLAQYMLSKGLITKEGLDRTVENLSDVQTALPYVKKALDLLEEAKASTKTASDTDTTPARVGRGAPKAPQVKTAAANLEDAGRRFERALGL